MISPLFVILLTTTLASATAAAPAHIIGYWTLYGFSRRCSPTDNQCDYTFDLTQDESGASQPARRQAEGGRSGKNYTQCAFAVTGGSETDFANVRCAPPSRLAVNGGWDRTSGDNSKNFLTLVVTDLSLNAYAFFSSREDEFIDDTGVVAATPTRPAYLVGTFDVATAAVAVVVERDLGALQRLQIARLHRCEPPLPPPFGWCSDCAVVWQPEMKAMFISFFINGDDGSIARCELRITNTDPKGSWYGKGCAGFTVSWGYKDDTDGAVMTVCEYVPPLLVSRDTPH